MRVAAAAPRETPGRFHAHRGLDLDRQARDRGGGDRAGDRRLDEELARNATTVERVARCTTRIGLSRDRRPECAEDHQFLTGLCSEYAAHGAAESRQLQL